MSTVERAVTPKPWCRISINPNMNEESLTSGVSFMLYTTTPWCSGVSSVIRPRCALSTWLPYRKGISPFGLIQT